MTRSRCSRISSDPSESQALPTVVHMLTPMLSVILVVSGLAQPPNDATPPTTISVDFGPIERLYGPSQDDTRGALNTCGSYVQGAQCVSDGFKIEGVAGGTAFIEVVTFPKGYLYAPHDLFGSLLRTAAYAAKKSRRGIPSGAGHKVRCAEWKYADGTQTGIVCYARIDSRPIQEGVVGWFTGNPDDGVVTVRIGYRHPRGQLPGQVIDKYLREYPSDVPANPTWHHDWERKDIEKWKDVLRSNQDDVRMLQAGATYLMRYDRGAFGLLDALRQRDKRATFLEALKGVDQRMSDWVEQRKKARPSQGKDE